MLTLIFCAFDVFQVKIALGSGVTRGLGAGGKPEVGQAAAKESLPDIEKVLAGADMVFVTAGKSTVHGSVGNIVPSFLCWGFLFCVLEGVCLFRENVLFWRSLAVPLERVGCSYSSSTDDRLCNARVGLCGNPVRMQESLRIKADVSVGKTASGTSRNGHPTSFLPLGILSFLSLEVLSTDDSPDAAVTISRFPPSTLGHRATRGKINGQLS